MSEPQRLTEEELAEIAGWKNDYKPIPPVIYGSHREQLFGHIAAQDAELDAKDAQLARIGAITMGLIPEPEPTEGVEAKVWQMVKAHNEELAQAVDDRKDAEKELAGARKEVEHLTEINGDAAEKLCIALGLKPNRGDLRACVASTIFRLTVKDEEIARLSGEVDGLTKTLNSGARTSLVACSLCSGRGRIKKTFSEEIYDCEVCLGKGSFYA